MDSVKLVKIRRCKIQKAMRAVLRLVEICIFLMVLSRSATLLLPSITSVPAVFIKPSGEYLRGVFLSLVSPRIVFVLGNLIVIVLFLNWGKPSSLSSLDEDNEGLISMMNKNNIRIDLYDEYVESCFQGNNSNNNDNNKDDVGDKLTIVHHHNHDSNSVCEDNNTEKRIMQRSQSEKAMMVKSRSSSWRCEEVTRRVLRRSETEKLSLTMRKVDKMSNEEFRSRVESFIARQQRLIKQEVKQFTFT